MEPSYSIFLWEAGSLLTSLKAHRGVNLPLKSSEIYWGGNKPSASVSTNKVISHLGSSCMVAQRERNLHKAFSPWNFSENLNRVISVTRKELVGENLWVVKNLEGWVAKEWDDLCHPSNGPTKSFFWSCWSLPHSKYLSLGCGEAFKALSPYLYYST